MTRFRVLVADDEPLARTMVTRLLERDQEFERPVQCADAQGVRDALARQPFDIAFLDIEMPGTSGMEIATTAAPGGPVVVFVTAFSRYAPEAFGVSAVDYVLKPFTDERFFAAVERAKLRVRERRLAELAGQLATVSAEIRQNDGAAAPPFLHWLPCPQGERSILIKATDIIWIEAEDYYVLVHSKRGRHMLRATLTSLGERLDPRLFLRVHRTAIINVMEVTEVSDEDHLVVVLSNGARVAVSRSRRRDVESVLLPQLRTSK